jgi:hypothetical protein
MKLTNPSIKDNLPWKTTSKYQKGNLSATTPWIVTYEFFGGILRKTQSKTKRKSRVWLCSAQLVPDILTIPSILLREYVNLNCYSTYSLDSNYSARSFDSEF